MRRRVFFYALLVAVVGAWVAIFGWAGMQLFAYSVDRLSFYESGLPLDKDLNSSKNYNAWCDAGANLATSGPPPWRCAIITAFKKDTPRIRLELDVSYNKNRPWSSKVPVTCTLADERGKVVAKTQITGVVPNPLYHRLDRTWWLAEFDRPGASPFWAPGRYLATCETPRASIQAWLDIAP